MKIIIAPDSYKESLTAPEVAEQIADGFRDIFPAISMIAAATCGQRPVILRPFYGCREICPVVTLTVALDQ